MIEINPDNYVDAHAVIRVMGYSDGSSLIWLYGTNPTDDAQALVCRRPVAELIKEVRNSKRDLGI